MTRHINAPSPAFLGFDFVGNVTASQNGVQVYSGHVNSGMMPIPSMIDLSIGSNSISFDINGQHESLAYNASNVITLSHTQKCTSFGPPALLHHTAAQCPSLMRPLTNHSGPGLWYYFPH
jgi:hypothetical protein